MSGSRIGGLKAAATNKAKYGDNFYSELGRMGGQAVTLKPKGFAANPKLAKLAGFKGGSKSKRGRNHTTKKVVIGGIEMTRIIVRKINTPAQKVKVYHGNN